MGRIIIKAAPDRDLYVEWSTIVEAPVFIGDRAETLAHLKRNEERGQRFDAPEARLKRADQTGTSAKADYSWFGAWDDNGLIYQQRGTVWRENLPAFLDAYQRDDEKAALLLVEPFESEMSE